MDFAMPREFAQFLIFSLAVSFVSLLLGIWIAYAVLKAAIRDGINASKLPDILRRSVAAAGTEERGKRPAEAMPPIRAER